MRVHYVVRLPYMRRVSLPLRPQLPERLVIFGRDELESDDWPGGSAPFRRMAPACAVKDSQLSELAARLRSLRTGPFSPRMKTPNGTSVLT